MPAKYEPVKKKTKQIKIKISEEKKNKTTDKTKMHSSMHLSHIAYSLRHGCILAPKFKITVGLPKHIDDCRHGLVEMIKSIFIVKNVCRVMLPCVRVCRVISPSKIHFLAIRG